MKRNLTIPTYSSTTHIWTPGCQETGGIQHYSRCLVEALLAASPAVELRVHAKNDRAGHLDWTDADGQTVISTCGKYPGALRTLMFSLLGCWHAWRERPNLIITTHPHFTKALRWVKRLTGIPYIASSHGIEVWGQFSSSFGTAMREADGHLPVSEFTRQVLIKEFSIAPERAIVVPDTFRESKFSPGPKPSTLLARHGLTPDQPVILTVGRLSASERYKGHDQVIAALPAIREKLPELKYIIVGTGDDEARLRQCAADHGQTEAVIFSGFVPDHELADYYRLCDAFVMPSTGEGFGIVYLEAGASGRPSVAGNTDASPEALNFGELGLLVDPRSPEQIADAVLRLLGAQQKETPAFKPEVLRARTIELYGQAAFNQHLDRALRALGVQISATAKAD